MKYNYFCSIRSGKFLIRSQFWYNRRSCAFVSPSNPLWCVLSRPIDLIETDIPIDKLEWYWCDRETKELKKHHYYLDTRDKLTDAHYDEQWYPITNSRGHEFVPKEEWCTHKNFYGCVDDILQRDLIVNPLPLLGYTDGGLGSRKMQHQLSAGQGKFTPAPYILEELRKRKSIIPYKEDIRDMAYTFFAGNGRPESSEEVTEQINCARSFRKLLPEILERYDMPYEMFSLDTSDYCKTFGLEQSLPRDSSDKLFRINEWNQDVDKQVDEYMKNYG